MALNFKITNPTKTYLVIANILLVFFLILLSNLKILPFKSSSDFVFFAFLVFALALYRPSWAFLFFVGTVAPETVTLAPENFGFSIRPYQLIGGTIILALLVRLACRRLPFESVKLQWADYLLGAAVLAGVVSASIAYDKAVAMKLAAVSVSFFALYVVCRNYLQQEKDLTKIIPFFISSALLITGYGIWQNIQFARGLSNFEVMPGRPNATFSEPDWLGIYLVLLVALIYSLTWYVSAKKKNNTPVILNFKFKISNLFLFIFLTLVYILLILTVSRSAWVGAFFVTLVFLFLTLTELKFNFRKWNWVNFLKYGAGIGASAGISIIVIYFFSLTHFQLFNRVWSAASGLQKITLACPGNLDVAHPGEISDLSEAAKYGCRHINLEDIEKERTDGNLIIEASRPDPNFSIRKNIYQKSWDEIKAHPILGIGWGNIEKILGNDERGTALNSSNIFLEVWLGSGILGLLAFAGFWIWIIIKSICNFSRKDGVRKYIGLFIILGSAGLIVVNLFNAGVFLGVLYLFFAVAMI